VVKRIGTFSRAALSAPQIALAVPALTCTMDRGNLAGHHGVAMRHRHREVLVHGNHRLRRRDAARLGLSQRLDNRREIGSRIGKELIDTALGQQRQVGLGDAVDAKRLLSHVPSLS
jgi:hypothetical protein